MSRPRLLLAAALTLLAADAGLLLSARANRGGAVGPAIELSERELPFVAHGEERPWVTLRLAWRADPGSGGQQAPWLDRERLGALGFSTALAAEDPGAPGYYGWQPARRVWLVLELDGDAARRWREHRERELAAALGRLGDDPAADAEADRLRRELAHERLGGSRLFVVDAGLDATILRQRWPDPGRHLLMRGVVAANLYRRWDPVARASAPPVIQGFVARLEVEELQLPRAARAWLDELARRDREQAGTAGGADFATPGRPRYRARIRFGSRHAPWVEAVEPLPAT